MNDPDLLNESTLYNQIVHHTSQILLQLDITSCGGRVT